MNDEKNYLVADFEKIESALSTLDVDGYKLSCEKVNKHGTMAGNGQQTTP